MEFREIEIKGNIYKVYPTGDVYSRHGKLKSRVKNNSYLYVSLGRGTNGYNNFYVHRLVAILFIPNPMNKPHVNHIDSNRANNNVSNLEWVTSKENIHHCKRLGRARYPKRKPVLQYSIDFDFIKEWESPRVAAVQLECTKELIQQAANPNNITCYSGKGFLWIYKQSVDQFPLEKHKRAKQKFLYEENKEE